MAKTEMNAFTFRDISLASTQGTLVEYVPLLGYTNQSKKRGAVYTFVTLLFFLVSFSILTVGLFMAYKARRDLRRFPQFIKEPLFRNNRKAELTRRTDAELT